MSRIALAFDRDSIVLASPGLNRSLMVAWPFDQVVWISILGCFILVTASIYSMKVVREGDDCSTNRNHTRGSISLWKVASLTFGILVCQRQSRKLLSETLNLR